ncbi:hypothetical protein D3C85_1924800 [compost metagenome]
MVTMPAVPPYSSMTMAMWVLAFCICLRTAEISTEPGTARIWRVMASRSWLSLV